jgi:hypothetical protein
MMALSVYRWMFSETPGYEAAASGLIRALLSSRVRYKIGVATAAARFDVRLTAHSDSVSECSSYIPVQSAHVGCLHLC